MIPRFWVTETDLKVACGDISDSRWFLVFRGMTNVMTNSRNAVFTVIPGVAAGNSAPICLLKRVEFRFAFVACANSFVFDYATRQKLAGGNLNFFIVQQLPMLPPERYAEPCRWAGGALRDWLLPHVLELTYTAWDLEAFAKDCGYDGPPFRWDESRRFLLRCELDAAYFHLYGLSCADAAYIPRHLPHRQTKGRGKAQRRLPHQARHPRNLRRDEAGDGRRQTIPNPAQSAARRPTLCPSAANRRQREVS